MKREFRNWLEDKKRVSTRSYLNNGKLIIPNPDIEKELELVIKKYDELHKPAVIPQYVAEYLEFAKSDVPLKRVMEIANRRNELPKWRKEYDWISANDEAFARAWLDGYEVEEELLYHALVKGHELTDFQLKCWIYNKSSDELSLGYPYSLDSKYAPKLSKEDWNKLGINDSNADFVKVKEVEE